VAAAGYQTAPAADRPSLIAPMIGAVIGLILLVAIVVLYVIVVLLGFVGIHVPVPGFR
jgi:hypothetical protein